MTTSFRRRRLARRPAVLSVSDQWRRDDAGAMRRRVVLRTAAGEVVAGWMLDDAAALVEYLSAVAA